MRRGSFIQTSFESSVFKTRIYTGAILFLILFLLVMARLFYLQVWEHTKYTTLSDKNRIQILAIAPMRGQILDRNGVVLAENTPAFRLELVPEQVKDLPATLAKIQQWVPVAEEDLTLFQQKWKKARAFEPIALKTQLSEQQVALLAFYRHQLPGVQISASLNRRYPYKASFAHVVGYVGRISEKDLELIDAAQYEGSDYIGKTGLEAQYEALLHGTVGYQEVEVNVLGRPLRTLHKVSPIPGTDLHLSLDIRLQHAAEQAFAGRKGALIAVDPKTGEVLAMLSAPAFDPNLFVSGISKTDYQALQAHPSKPLYDRALRGLYPPASTIKPYLAFVGLENKVITPQMSFWDSGHYSLPGQSHVFRDWKPHGHGQVNLQEALIQSCDVYFYQLAHHLGIERLSSGLKRFGFGEKTNIDLPGEPTGIVPNKEWKQRALKQNWYAGETISVGIGQGYLLATPLQLVQALSILANKGEPTLPLHLVRAQMAFNQPIQNTVHTPLSALIAQNPQYWEHIHTGMKDVIHSARGTARRIYTPDFSIAGKTGTAQVFGLKANQKYQADKTAAHLRDHTLFIAMSPAEDPKIAVAVILENEKGAPEIAKQVLTSFFEQEHGT